MDKAANQKTWLIRKDAGDMRTQLVPDGKGGFKTVAAEPAAAPEASSEAPAPVESTAAPVSKSSKEMLLATAAKLTALAEGPEAEADSEEFVSALTKALEVFEAAEEPVENPLTEEVLKQTPAEVAKAATGAAMKLLEIAQSLGLKVDDGEAVDYPSSVRWKVSEVLDILVPLANLERSQPAAAAQIAASVGAVAKSDPRPDAEAFKLLAQAVQKSLYSELHTLEDIGVDTFDVGQATKLLTDAETVIRKLHARVTELERSPQLSNAIAVETAVLKSNGSGEQWAWDLAAEVAAESAAEKAR